MRPLPTPTLADDAHGASICPRGVLEFHFMRRADERSALTRRRMLQSTGGFIAAAALPFSTGVPPAAARSPQDGRAAKITSDYTGQLARYMVAARTQPLPAPALLAAKHRVL